MTLPQCEKPFKAKEGRFAFPIIIAIILVVLYVILFTDAFQSLEGFRGQGVNAFFPIHAVTTTIALLAFIGLVYMIYSIQQNLDKKTAVDNQKNKKIWCNKALPLVGLDSGAAAGVGALAVALGAAFLSNFVQIPTIDYQITESTSLEGYLIHLDNLGNAPAKHVQIYLNKPDTIFEGFISQPFLNDHVKQVIPDTSDSIPNPTDETVASDLPRLSLGEAFLEIDNVPAFSRTDLSVRADIPNQTESSDNLPFVSVRADETVGKRGTIYLIGFYVLLAIVFMTLPVLLWAGKIHRTAYHSTWIVILVSEFVILAAILVGFVHRT